mgnify:CR=1 FL=1
MFRSAAPNRLLQYALFILVAGVSLAYPQGSTQPLIRGKGA